MDGLDEFEKALAAEKGERERIDREKEERRQRKKQRHHRHERDETRNRSPHRRRHRERSPGEHERRRDRDDKNSHRSDRRKERDGGGNEHKRSRHSRDEQEPEDRHKKRRQNNYVKDSDPKEDLPLPDEEDAPLSRDSWMTTPSAIEVDYVQRRQAKPETAAPKEPDRIVHDREINRDIGQAGREAATDVNPTDPGSSSASYTFGDKGSQWRMTKLKAVYTIAEETGRAVDDVALDRFGDLREFDEAREERVELDRRRIYGETHDSKQHPSGHLYRERLQHADNFSRSSTTQHIPPKKEATVPEQGAILPDDSLRHTPMDQTTLNRLRAQMVKAKLRKAPDAAKLEAEYNEAAARFDANGPTSVVLGVHDNRMLAGGRHEVKAVETKRGRERGQVEANDDMTIEDMVREERRTRGEAGGEGKRLAERIAKDGKFDNDLEYMDENADKLAKRVHKSEINLKNVAVHEYQKVNRILDKCPLCYHEDKDQPPIAPVISLGTRVYLTLPTEPEVSEGGAIIVPVSHRKNLLECDDDEWEEIRNFMKSLTRLYHEKGQDVIFYENAAAPQRHPHAAMAAMPIPYEDGAMVPAYFKEAFLSTDDEWAQHRKVIDTGAKAADGLGRMAFRRSIAKEMPYFHVWFSLDGGLGHIVENADRWPRGDLFAREIVGGIMDVAPDIIKKQGRWRKDDSRVEGFKQGWRKFDWTRVLAES